MLTAKIEEKELFDYQARFIEKVFSFFKTRPAGKLLATSPTGTGKTLMQLRCKHEILKASKGAARIHVITPKIQIVADFLQELGFNTDNLSYAKIRKLGAENHIYTYGTYVNLLIKGLEPSNVLFVDEGHHLKLGNTQAEQILYDAHMMKVVAMTATGYRATPNSTREFLEEYEEKYVCISEREAVKRGLWRFPQIKIRGVMDDDVLVVQGNEFKIAKMSDIDKCAGATFFETIRNLIKEERHYSMCNFHMHLPIIVEVPGVEIAQELNTYLRNCDVPANCLTAKTKIKDREKAIRELKAGTHVLVEVSIVSEGFNLPALSVFIDANPTMSPGRFMQKFGRLTRRSDIKRKVYYCLCRNIERHAYLLDGIIPTSAVIEAQNAFQTVSIRAGQRVFGSEKFGKFKPLPFETSNGTFGSFYLVSSFDNGTNVSTKYAIVLLPHKAQPLVFKKQDRKVNVDPEKPWDWGKWEKSFLPEGFAGYKTVAKRKTISEKQQNYWNRAAARVGLVPDREVDAREFQILPILDNTNTNINGE